MLWTQRAAWWQEGGLQEAEVGRETGVLAHLQLGPRALQPQVMPSLSAGCHQEVFSRCQVGRDFESFQPWVPERWLSYQQGRNAPMAPVARAGPWPLWPHHTPSLDSLSTPQSLAPELQFLLSTGTELVLRDACAHVCIVEMPGALEA